MSERASSLPTLPVVARPEKFPPRDGILEVVGYLVVASEDAQHYVPGDQYADVQLGDGGSVERWRVPEVLFSRSE